MSNRLYILLTTECYLCNPNNDPYTNSPRVLDDDSGRLFITPESLRWHIRRSLETLRHTKGQLYGFKEDAIKKSIGSTQVVKRYFEDQPQTLKASVDQIEQAFGVKCDTRRKLIEGYSLDTGFFGILYATDEKVKEGAVEAQDGDNAVVEGETAPAKEKGKGKARKGANEAFHTTGVFAHLSWPIATHRTWIMPYAVNNAFVNEKDGITKESSGSNSSTKVGYAFLTSLAEVKIDDLVENFRNSELFVTAWDSPERREALCRLLVDAVSEAYGAYGITSKTQTGHRVVKCYSWEAPYLKLGVDQLPHNWFFSKLGSDVEVRSLAQIKQVKECFSSNYEEYRRELGL